MNEWRRYERMVMASWRGTPNQAMDDEQGRGPHLGLSLAGEAGEVVELLKKAHRRSPNCQTVEVDKLIDELGDVLWSVVSIAMWAGHSLEDVRVLNEEKMWARHANLMEEVPD